MNVNVKSNSVQRFFWWCAGANLNLLEKCRNDWSKYTASGMFVLVVASVAVLLMIALLSATFRVPILLALAGGFFWGYGVIFLLDRTMLAYYRKGKGEIQRAAFRIIVSIILSMLISDTGMMMLFSGEIEARMADKQRSDASRVEKQLTGDKQAKIEQLGGELKALNDQLTELHKRCDEAEKAMNAERDGATGTGLTGRTGKGVHYEWKKEDFEQAKKALAEQEPKLIEQINAKQSELKTIEDEIQKGKAKADEFYSRAKGLLARHEALFGLVREDKGAAFWFLLMFFSLLFIETFPVTQKLSAAKTGYDYLVQEVDKLDGLRARYYFKEEHAKLSGDRQISQIIRDRIANAVMIGDLSLLQNPVERQLAERIILKIIRRQTDELYLNQNDENKVDLGKPITIEAVGFTNLSAQMTLPSDLEDAVTLADLANEIETFEIEVSKTSSMRQKLVKATNSSNEEIEPEFLPLLHQLKQDRRLLLYFKKADNSNPQIIG